MTDIRNDMPAVMARLRAWSFGYKPSTAAVEFLIATGQVQRAVNCGLVVLENDEHAGPVAYITHVDDWVLHAGAYSSGEYAILRLVSSLHHGELDATLWSMDRTNRKAFTDAITLAGAR